VGSRAILTLNARVFFLYFTPILNWCQVRKGDSCPESARGHPTQECSSTCASLRYGEGCQAKQGDSCCARCLDSRGLYGISYLYLCDEDVTQSNKISQIFLKKSETPRVVLYITVLYVSHVFSMRETRHHGLCGGGSLRLARYVKYYRQRPQTCT